MPTSPVLERQGRAGEQVREVFGWRLPSVYSTVREEYEAATGAAALLDRSYIGRLKVTGADGMDLLDRLTTNKLDDLVVTGQGMPTVLTSNKGRILDVLYVLKRDDHFLVLCGPESRQKAVDWIDFYTFAEDVSIQDITEGTAMLAIMGPQAPDLVTALAGRESTALTPYGSTHTAIDGIDALVVRTDFTSLPCYEVIADVSHAEQLWQHILKAGEGFGVRPMGMDALELVRVEQGVPEYGKEMTEGHNPLEASLMEFISFNKGCYVGQEVVARLDTYDKVQNHLVGLSWRSKDGETDQAGLFLDEKKVGEVTSAVTRPGTDTVIGLGYVKKAHAKPGVTLSLGRDRGAIEAVVEELPFKPAETQALPPPGRPHRPPRSPVRGSSAPPGCTGRRPLERCPPG